MNSCDKCGLVYCICELEETKNSVQKGVWKNKEDLEMWETRTHFEDNNTVERLTRINGGWLYVYGNRQGVTSQIIPEQSF